MVNRIVGLFTVLFLFIVFNTQAQEAKFNTAQQKFKNLSYVEAIRNYEAFLRSADADDKNLQEALENLAFSYRKVQDYKNAERVFIDLFKVFEEKLSSEQFLYYAQTLASNEKYRESQRYYSKYGQRQKDDLRAQKFTVAYMDNSAFYKDSALYRIQYLDAVNSRQADFSPMYFEDGLVFVSARDEGGIVKRIFMQNETPFLDLFLFPDTTLLSKPVSADPNAIASLSSSGPSKASDTDNWETKFSIEKDIEVDEFSKQINSKYHEGPVTFFKDYQKLVFTRNNYSKGRSKKSKDGINMLKLYSSEKGKKKWGDINELPFNSDEYSCGHPALNSNDSKLYFVSDMPGGFGGTDIYVVDYINGKWGSPINLGREINTEGNEMFPYVDENDNLYFSSDGHAGLGGLDIFYAKLQNGRIEGELENIGYPVNSEKDDFGLITDGDRSEGYFSSNRKRGYSDDNIYAFRRKCRELKLLVHDAETGYPLANVEVRLIQNGINQALFLTDSDGKMSTCIASATDFEFKAYLEGYEVGGVSYGTMSLSQSNKAEIKIYLQPSKLPIVRGTIRSELTNQPIAGARVLLKNSKDDSEVAVITGVDGKYEFQPQKKGKYFVSAVKEKYATNTEEIGKIKTNKSKNISYEQNLGMIAEGDIFRIENIYYDYGKATIRPEARKSLEKHVLLVLKKYPSLAIEIRSHTDSRATSEFNQELSNKRAEEVTTYLIKKGINPQRLISRGYGETQLVNNCTDGISCDENKHQQNRRTEFKILAVEQQYSKN
ncbi:Outer membrane protein OmpA [Spirosomataceae bacterium TFI 002]|nr:Outer membrane protein OmpA [Spirosomataceae bacterium TFI 002]